MFGIKKRFCQKIVDLLNGLLDASAINFSDYMQEKCFFNGFDEYSEPIRTDLLGVVDEFLKPYGYKLRIYYECDQHDPSCIAWIELQKI